MRSIARQVLTLEGWSAILYQTQDSTGYAGATIFFVMLVAWGSFFAVNLTLAVLESNFETARDELREAAYSAADLTRTQRGEIARIFMGFDVDGSGAMDAAELGQAMALLELNPFLQLLLSG
jgi:hypothetical protein